MKSLLTGFVRVTAVAALAAVPLTVTATPAAAEPILSVVDGQLDWGVKESFRNYITGPIAGGEITLSDGAVEHADGTFGFTAASGEYDLGGHSVTAGFEGAVNFTGHHGALDVTLSQVRVTTDNAASSGEIVADVSSKDMETGETHVFDDITFAVLDLTGITPETGDDGYTTLAGVPAALTAVGAEAFAGFYEEGADLDPATIAIKADAAEDGGDTPGNDNDGSIVDGHADWGVKKSFRDYIVGPVAGGSIELSDGATDNGNGFRFPEATGEYDASSGALSVTFAGTVHFLGHEHDGSHELDLLFTDVTIESDGADAALYVNDVHFVDIALPADGLTVDGDLLSLVEATTTLTAEGETYFEGFYSAGDELDPLSLQLALSDEVELPGTTPGNGNDGAGGPSFGSGRLPTTGAGLTLPITIGIALLVGGGIALWWTRRQPARAA